MIELNRITAKSGLSPHMGNIEHLSIYIDDKRLDELLAEKVQEEYLGLIPSWLNFYDNDNPASIKEKRYVWQQTQLFDKPVVLPILLCPDDFDFSCTVIVVEVVCVEDKVIWRKFGIDTTPFEIDEIALPKYIGKKVDWFENIGSFEFLKTEYLLCVSQFADKNSIIN